MPVYSNQTELSKEKTQQGVKITKRTNVSVTFRLLKENIARKPAQPPRNSMVCLKMETTAPSYSARRPVPSIKTCIAWINKIPSPKNVTLLCASRNKMCQNITEDTLGNFSAIA